MIPSPMNAIVLTSLLDSVRVVGCVLEGSARRALVAGQPVEGVLAGRLVFESDIAAIPVSGELVQIARDVKCSGAGFAAPRCVGDLHVSDARGVRVDRRADVVPVDREVVEVGEQSQGLDTVVGLNSVDHRDGITPPMRSAALPASARFSVAVSSCLSGATPSIRFP